MTVVAMAQEYDTPNPQTMGADEIMEEFRKDSAMEADARGSNGTREKAVFVDET